MTSTSDDDDQEKRPNMRPEPDPIANEVRKQRQARRLPPDAACACCGETQMESLRTGPGVRSLLEQHHVAGRANDQSLIAVLCLNCHAKATAAQHEVGALPPGEPRSCLEAMANAMRSLGSFFELLAEACYRWALQLAQVVTVLDTQVPGWRTLPGMP